jgi:hypothetical protein
MLSWYNAAADFIGDFHISAVDYDADGKLSAYLELKTLIRDGKESMERLTENIESLAHGLSSAVTPQLDTKVQGIRDAARELQDILDMIALADDFSQVAEPSMLFYKFA